MRNIHFIKADITTLQVEAIVNAANNSMMGGGGVDGAIHRAAGAELAEACRMLNGCATGQSKITPGFALPSKYIIHTVGPVWNNGTSNEDALLKSCYRSVLELALQHKVRSIAFPSISTGAYRFPFDRAAGIAYHTVSEFLSKHTFPECVYFVCYNDADLKQFERVIKKTNMSTTVLYRPVGQKEFDLIKAGGFRFFPPRLHWQPIFYPVLDYEYACTIARDWNTNDAANGSVGYVTKFEIPGDYAHTFEIHNVGASNHNELWVPASELEQFNSKIVNGIKVIKAYYGEDFKGERIYE